MVRLGAVWLLATATAAAAVDAQTVLRGVVVDDATRAPIPGALVQLATEHTAATTDRLGRFALSLGQLPDSLRVTAVGWRPMTLVLEALPSTLTLAMERAPMAIAELIVAAPAARPLDLSEHGRWRMPADAVRSVPPAVEPDVYRSLAMVPAVSFTSPLSARPMIRGYDAQEVTTRIDGFEIFNLYHLGRVFSSFPADGAEHVSVTAAPFTSSVGGSVAGVIDIAGRSGTANGFDAGVGTSLGSLGAWAGGGAADRRFFGAARVLHLKALDLVPGVSFPYHFEDVYGSAVFGPAERPAGRVTLFGTRDDAGDEASGLRWTNLLLGVRGRLVERGLASLEASASVVRLDQTGIRVPSAYRGLADFRNRFDRSAVGLDLTVTGAGRRLAAGITAGWRDIANRITPSEAGSIGVPATGSAFGRFEGAGYLELSERIGSLTIEAGVRAEAAGRATVLDPRVHLRFAPHRLIELSAGLGRASRLFHLLGDARSEPDLDYLDVWLNPDDSIPTARARHATLDLNVDLRPIVARLSAFAARGDGIGEVRPETDHHPTADFRFGRSRTHGFEAQVGLRGAEQRRAAASVTYVYSRSERNWGEGWIPWAQDRRHQLRIFGQARLGRVQLFGTVDAASGMPLTPILGHAERPLPGAGPPAVGGVAFPTAVYGRESSVATAGTLRVDGALTYSFGGEDGQRVSLGASVINLLGGAVAPITPFGEGTMAVDQLGRPTPYRRLFDLPPIPTLTLRVRF
ncbi:MAG: carboxypeptidase regulatory-like domain-containing protein [Gemmatimonadales bacterium]